MIAAEYNLSIKQAVISHTIQVDSVAICFFYSNHNNHKLPLPPMKNLFGSRQSKYIRQDNYQILYNIVASYFCYFLSCCGQLAVYSLFRLLIANGFDMDINVCAWES